MNSTSIAAVNKSALESLLARTDVWLMFFGVVVVIGVAGESIFGIRHWLGSRRLQVIQNEEERQRIAQAQSFEAQIATANEGAASALARAAASEQAASEARLQQERLKAQLAWRAVTPEMASTMGPILSQNRGSVVIAYTANDPEALWLSIQLSRVFATAGWQLRPEARTYPTQIIFGIVVPGNSNDSQNIRSAFTAAGVAFTTDDVPQPTQAFNVVIGGPASALIMVGSKAPPF